MDASDIRTIADLEDRHWWFKERRAILARWLRKLDRAGAPAGVALDIGAAGGGNTRVLRRHGWRPVALEYSEQGAAVAAERGLTVLRGDATNLPAAAGSVDLVTAFDVIEHIEDDYLAAAEIRRVLRPGGTLLVTVPPTCACGPRTTSSASTTGGTTGMGCIKVITKAGLEIDELWSWNVLLRPAVALSRKRSSGNALGPTLAAGQRRPGDRRHRRAPPAGPLAAGRLADAPRAPTGRKPLRQSPEERKYVHNRYNGQHRR